MSEKRREILRLLFHPEYGGYSPSESLDFAAGILGRVVGSDDIAHLTDDETERLVGALRKQYPSMFKTAVNALGQPKK